MARKGYTQLQDTQSRLIWLHMVGQSMGLDPEAHRDRVRIYDFALAALAAQLTAADLRESAGEAEVTAEPALTDPEPWERELSHYEYTQSQKYSPRVAGEFIPYLAALMRAADTDNNARLTREFPVIRDMLQRRYNAQGGVLPEIDGFTVDDLIERQEAMHE